MGMALDQRNGKCLVVVQYGWTTLPAGQWRNEGWNYKQCILLFLSNCAAQNFLGEDFNTVVGGAGPASMFPLLRLSPLSSPAITEGAPLFLASKGLWPSVASGPVYLRSFYHFVHTSHHTSVSLPVSLHCVWKRAFAGCDQKLQVFFHVFVFSSPAPGSLLEGAVLESDSGG